MADPPAWLLASSGPQPWGGHLPWAAASSSSSSYSRSLSPRLGSEDGERVAAFSLQRLGHGLGLAPQDGEGGGGVVGMEEGNGVKQRRDEVGSDRETAQTCGPASREEERRGLTSVSSGCRGNGAQQGMGGDGAQC